jgi:transposase InsO family protein
MPWRETRVMDQKVKMISNWLSGEYDLTELSRIHQVSRKTLYKWIERYGLDPDSGLKERSRRPFIMPRATPIELVSEILALKSQHEHWGSRKLLAWLKSHDPEKRWPAASTTSEILKRHGMVHSRRKRHHTPPYSQPFLKSNQPNEVWCADFKGQFRLGEGSLCYPLTLTDSHSRFLLGCWGLNHPAYLPTRANFERAFQEYGLPNAIRTDNGVPFASVGLGGLSSLATWFIKLGIRPERIEKGHPEQNGRHERMHRTLKAESISPPRKSLNEQQRAFDRFRSTYNNERPHEALGQRTPASIYRRSSREYPSNLKEVEYPQSFNIRQVKDNGAFKWKGNELYLSSVLSGELIGLKEIEAGIWQIYFSYYPLGILDDRTFRVTPNKSVTYVSG